MSPPTTAGTAQILVHSCKETIATSKTLVPYCKSEELTHRACLVQALRKEQGIAEARKGWLAHTWIASLAPRPHACKGGAILARNQLTAGCSLAGLKQALCHTNCGLRLVEYDGGAIFINSKQVHHCLG